MGFPEMEKTLLKMWETQVLSLGQEDPLEEKILSSILAWGVPWTEELRVGVEAAAIVHGVAKSRTQLSE